MMRVDDPRGANLGFEALNRGKRSMTLDLKQAGAAAVMERLVRWADVVCENFRPGVMDSLGFGYERCRTWNPNIIYASNSGFGPKGDWAHDRAFDGVAQAFTGAATMQGGGPSHEPCLIDFAFSDEVGAMSFYASIISALFARERTGKGQQISTSQTAATLHFQRGLLATSIHSGNQRDDGMPPWRDPPGLVLQQLHKASDGKWLVISALQKDMWERFCESIIASEISVKDPRVVDRFSDPIWLNGEIKKVIAEKPRQHWLDLCRANRIPCAPCSSYAEIGDAEDMVGKHMRVNGYIVDVEHRQQGTLTMVAPPTQYSETPTRPAKGESWHAPLLGEHTMEALVFNCGYSPKEAEELMASGVCPISAARFANYRASPSKL